MKSIIDEDLSVSGDSDFDDLFPTPDDGTKPSEFDELVTVVGDSTEEDYSPEEECVPVAAPKKRGRPAKSTEKKAITKKKSTDDDQKNETAHKKRGRPAKKAAVAEIIEEPENIDDTQIQEKKTRGKRVSVDDFPPEMLDRIFEEYSQHPAAEFAKELEIPEKYLHRAISRMKELFEMAISTGDLTQEEYDEFIAPKFEEYKEPEDKIQKFVAKRIKHLKK